jgi:hypothetical protein
LLRAASTSLAALRKLAAEAVDGLLDAEAARAMGKLKAAKTHGSRLGNLLSQKQA